MTYLTNLTKPLRLANLVVRSLMLRDSFRNEWKSTVTAVAVTSTD